MAERPLTPTSYLVLGIVRDLQPCTSYDMKQFVKVSIGNFWSFPHSQLYAEPARLVEDGLLVDEQEEGGRRRRLYRLTDTGAEALDDWRTEPVDDAGEIRDLALLKLFFADGADAVAVAALAHGKAAIHVAERDRLEQIRSEVVDQASAAQLATLDLGRRWNETWIGFWNDIAENPPVT